MSYLIRRARNNACNGMDRTIAEIDHQRYQEALQKVIKAYAESPTEAGLKAAEEAIKSFHKEYMRWVFPVVERLKQSASTTPPIPTQPTPPSTGN